MFVTDSLPMTPLKLTLKNFLSYRDAVLDFTGFHTACICGPNGAGKSSLLEAVTWVIWGKSRTSSADDVIHMGEMDVRVDFELLCHQQVYRIIRMRSRGRGATLQFQVRSPTGDFTSITGKGIRETQELIDQEIKLDYDTFINSAYLRQGHADEFMVAKPADRKKILSDLLKLDRYESLAQLAKDKARSFKLKADLLEESLAPQTEQLRAKPQLEAELAAIEQTISEGKQQENQLQEQLQKIQAIAQQQQFLKNQVDTSQQQYQRRHQDLTRLSTQAQQLQQDLAQNTAILHQTDTIEAEYQRWQTLQQQEEQLNQKSQQYQDLQQEQQTLQQTIQAEENKGQRQIQQLEVQIQTLTQQQAAVQETLAIAPDLTTALDQLKRTRNQINRLETAYHQAQPLLQQRQQLENQISQAAEKLKLQLAASRQQQQNLAEKIAQIPQQRAELQRLDQTMADLDRQKKHLDQIQQQHLDVSTQQVRFQDAKRNCQTQLQELQQKLALLQQPGATCPLCEQNLDHDHHQNVMAKTQAQYSATEAEILTFQNELKRCDQLLRDYHQELTALDQVRSSYESYDQQMIRLEQAIETNQALEKELKQVEQELLNLERALRLEAYAEDLRAELAEVQHQLETLEYDESQLAIARETEKEYRWAELKEVELNQARQRLDTLQREIPQQEAELETQRHQLDQNRQTSPWQVRLTQLQEQLNALNYDRNAHQQLRQALQQGQIWQQRYLELGQAQRQQTSLEAQLQDLNQRQTVAQTELAQLEEQITQLQENLDNLHADQGEINHLENQLQTCRQALETAITQRGQRQQSLENLQAIATAQKNSKTELKELRRQYRIHHELGQAFGKNGIQALMIENALPQLEAETNQILGRLTEHQFHVQFLTQKAKKGSKKTAAQMIDTLDIVIADARGTRAYETYSGGEAFRINFSIRLALAKLLAYRSGTTLQMLVIDEGFGTQDTEGCNRLIGAINAIAADFACILAVTHIPQFKEAFQSRIEVYKDQQGSQLQVNN
uniref:exonuclease subunit SbcC n=2 Tax=Picosynechococcus sp. PCC 8807 TaxID=195248 RepID=UPI0030DBDB1F